MQDFDSVGDVAREEGDTSVLQTCPLDLGCATFSIPAVFVIALITRNDLDVSLRFTVHFHVVLGHLLHRRSFLSFANWHVVFIFV